MGGVHRNDSSDLELRSARGRVLSDGLSTLRNSMPRQLTRQHEPDGGLDFPRREGLAVLVAQKAVRLVRDLLENVVQERVHDRHRLLRQTRFGMALLEHLVDVHRETLAFLLFRLARLGRAALLRDLLNQVLSSLGARLRQSDQIGLSGGGLGHIFRRIVVRGARGHRGVHDRIIVHMTRVRVHMFARIHLAMALHRGQLNFKPPKNVPLFYTQRLTEKNLSLFSYDYPFLLITKEASALLYDQSATHGLPP